VLGVCFPPSYRMFLLRLGAGDAGGNEFYGVIDDDFLDSAIPDGVWLTLRGRKDYGLPNSMVVVYELGNGEMFVIDTSQARVDGEAPVLAGMPVGLAESEDGEVVAEDFGTFFLEYVRHGLDLDEPDASQLSLADSRALLKKLKKRGMLQEHE